MRYGFGRGLLIVLLAAGAVLGFSAAFARHWGFHHGHGHYGWGRHGHGYASFEARAADACVRAAERVLKEREAPEAKAPAHPAPAPAPAPTP